MFLGRIVHHSYLTNVLSAINCQNKYKFKKMVFKENIITLCYMDTSLFFGIINKFRYYMMIVIDIIFFWAAIGSWIFDEFCVCRSDSLVTSPVKRRSEVVLCKNGDSRSAREISILYFPKSISVFMRKYDACTATKSVKKNWRIKRYWFFLQNMNKNI